jgi:hypothetical protein
MGDDHGKAVWRADWISGQWVIEDLLAQRMDSSPRREPPIPMGGVLARGVGRRHCPTFRLGILPAPCHWPLATCRCSCHRVIFDSRFSTCDLQLGILDLRLAIQGFGLLTLFLVTRPSPQPLIPNPCSCDIALIDLIHPLTRHCRLPKLGSVGGPVDHSRAGQPAFPPSALAGCLPVATRHGSLLWSSGPGKLWSQMIRSSSHRTPPITGRGACVTRGFGRRPCPSFRP